MAASRRKKLTLPKGSDVAAQLRRLQKRAVAVRTKRLEAEHQEFVKEARSAERLFAPFAESMGVEPATAKRTIQRAKVETLAKARPPAPKPPEGHNPSEYPPYELEWSWDSVWGAAYLHHWYGPNGATGRVGTSILVPPGAGGAVSTVSSVGFWYFAPVATTMHAKVQADVWGRTAAVSVGGYVRSRAALRIYVERYDTSGFRTWESSRTVYNKSGHWVADYGGVNSIETVDVSLWLRPRVWHAIWGDAVQSVFGTGNSTAVTNFSMTVSPISYSLD